jgi:hypothetical protein
MRLKDMLVSMFYTACVITTCMIFFIGLYLVLFTPHLILDGRDMLGVIFTAFVSVLPTLVFAMKDKMSYKGVLFLRTIHFILTAGIVFGSMMYFKWLNILNAVYFISVFFIVYIVVNVISTIRDKKLADKLNERINAFHDAENETHRKQP